MSSLVIVAIPAEDDIVWKVSSEKIPHLTLMYLGETKDADNVARMAEFVEHALNISEHGPFYMDVDYRGELGANKADVLFFQGGWDAKWIKSLRGQLLQQSDIRAAFEAAETFPEWVPHLTLGYPDAPANPIPDDRKIYSVGFDKIALWLGDYDGPEFRLRWPERENELSVAYSDTGKVVVGDLLEHFGVKGMRWGQRKTETVSVNGETKQVTPKKAEKLDTQWEKNQFTLSKGIERHNAMADHFNSRIGALNDKFAKDDFSKEEHDAPARWSPRYKEYNKEVISLQETSFRHAVEKVHGSSPTGKKKAVVEGDIRSDTMRVIVKNVNKVEHAAIEDGDEVFLYKITRNVKGIITRIEPVEDSMAQTAMYGEAFAEGLLDGMAHYGIKGMRWGVRNRRETPQPVTPQAVSKVPHGAKRKTKIDVEGGENHPAAEDAIKVAQARVKLAKSGPAALSNKELQEIANRVELEQRVKRVTQPSGRKFVSNLLRQHGNQAVNKQVKKKLSFN